MTKKLSANDRLDSSSLMGNNGHKEVGFMVETEGDGSTTSFSTRHRETENMGGYNRLFG